MKKTYQEPTATLWILANEDICTTSTLKAEDSGKSMSLDLDKLNVD